VSPKMGHKYANVGLKHSNKKKEEGIYSNIPTRDESMVYLTS